MMLHRFCLRLARLSLRQVIALIITFALTTLIVPPVLARTAAQDVAARLSEVVHHASVAFAGYRGLSDLFRTVQGQGKGMPPADSETPGLKPKRPPTKAEHESKVYRLELNPSGDVTLRSGERMIFAAIPLDADGNALHGLTTEWKSSAPEVVAITKEGEAIASKPGSAVLTASAGSKKEKIKVEVVEQSAGLWSDRVERAPGSLQKMKASSAELHSSIADSNSEQQHPNHFNFSAHALRATMLAALQNQTQQLPNDEISSLYEPANSVGAPPGKTTPGAITPAAATNGTETPGSANFDFSLPIVELPGRGFDVALSLTYNSRLWNRSTPILGGTRMTYDVDGGWLAPGFRIGYGQLRIQAGSLTLVDPDGTRHQMVNNPSGSNTYDSTDGTFIHLDRSAGDIATYPGGTQMIFGAAGVIGGSTITVEQPVKITDRNGNYILLSYLPGSYGTTTGPQRISSIQDTVGRYIFFKYDASNSLIAITAPGLTGQADLPMMRFYYQDIMLNQTGLFQSGVRISAPTTAHVIKYIYLPTRGSGSTLTGYRFDYSSYGMIYQMTQFRGMTISAAPTDYTQAGSVQTEGSMSAQTLYNYQGTPGNQTTGLSDAPFYTTRTDDWAGRVSLQPVYNFSVNQSTGVSTVTAPDGTLSETHTIVDSGNWDDGLISETSIKAGSNTLSDVVYSWEQGYQGAPRISQIQTTNDAGQTGAVVLSYNNTSYNNVSSVSERDFAPAGTLGAELRRTETFYQTQSSYTSRGLVRLPTSIKVYGLVNGAMTQTAQTDYGYDESSLADTPGISMYTDPGVAARRGNLTTTTEYVGFSTTPSSTVSHAFSYDLTGNMLTAQVDCCQQKSFVYSASYNYAYPTSITRGSGPNLTSSIAYDFNTGLTSYTSDENLQQTNIYYLSSTLRPEHIDYPDGGAVYYHYNDALFADFLGRQHYFINTSTRLDGTRIVDSYRFFDGRGAVTQTFDGYTSANGWSTQDIEYDVMGRAYRASNSYYCGGYGWVKVNPTDLWTTKSFDNLDRVTQVSRPSGDAQHPATSTATASYSGNLMLTSNPAGRQRLGKINALGLLSDVWEITAPDAATEAVIFQTQTLNGYHTGYTYDALDNLVKVAQGAQNRYFKYDALGRLIYEKQVEKNAVYTVSDALTSNSSWSNKYVYNSQGLVQDAYDARQIKAHFDYDGLNRIIQIAYSRPDGTPEGTPQVNYYYDSQMLPQGAPNFDRGYSGGRVVAVTYGGSGSATGSYFGYDAVGRVSRQRQVTGSNPYAMSYTYNLAGELTSEGYPSGRVMNYAYDEGGRLANVTDGTGATYDNGLTYAPHGGLTSETFGNSAVRSMSYNNALQASQIKLDLGGTEQQRYDYAYGALNPADGSVDTSKNSGQVGRIDGSIGGAKQWEQRLTYDSLGRLSQVGEYQQGNTSQLTYQAHYDYDRWANRYQYRQNTVSGYTPVQTSEIDQATNRFISTGPTPTAYDPAGNITADQKFRGMQYQYDANNRQKWAARMDGSNAQSAVYDGLGQRVRVSNNGVTREMVYDIFGQDIAEYSGGALERENIYRGGQLLASNETPPQQGGTQSVTWTNMIGVTANGNNLTKTAASAWGNSGAASTQTIASGDGSVEFTASETNTSRMCGLSHGDTDQNWQDIDYAFYIASDGIIYLYEAGAYRGGFGAYAAGDRFRVAVEGGVVKYYKNSTLLYTSSVAPVYPLLIDTALHTTGATLTNVIIYSSNSIATENIAWTNTVGVSSSANNLTKTAVSAWGNAGAVSTRSIVSGDGYVEFTATETNTSRMCGLSHGDTDQNWQDIDYAFYVANDGIVYIYEAGTYHSGYGAYLAGDHFRVAVEGGVVKYYRNSTLLYTSGVAPLYPLLVDTSINTTGATLSNVRLTGLLGGGGGGGVQYVLQDVQGSTRLVMKDNQIISRHDYLPFGEEIWAGTGLRSASQGYSVLGASSADHVRQKYGETERDEGTGLDHTRWRKYESGAGRFTGADPYLGSMSIAEPQSFNRYAYVENDPVNAIDPDGLQGKQGGPGDGGPGDDKFYTAPFNHADTDLNIIINDWLNRIGGVGGHPLYSTSRMLTEREGTSGDPWNSTPTYGDTRAVSAALSICGTVSSVNEYSAFSGSSWRGLNGVQYAITQHPNGATGPLSLAKEIGGAYRVLGRTAGTAGIVISGIQGVQSYRRGDNSGAAKFGVDTVMGVAGTFGGPWGAGAAGIYFGVDMTIGWNKMLPSKEEMDRPWPRFYCKHGLR